MYKGRNITNTRESQSICNNGTAIIWQWAHLPRSQNFPNSVDARIPIGSIYITKANKDSKNLYHSAWPINGDREIWTAPPGSQPRALTFGIWYIVYLVQQTQFSRKRTTYCNLTLWGVFTSCFVPQSHSSDTFEWHITVFSKSPANFSLYHSRNW